MISFDIKANQRSKIGSAESRRARRAGEIPVTILNKGENPLHVNINAKEFEREYFKGNILSTVVNIDVDGKLFTTIPHKVDVHPVTDFPIHIDFIKFEKNETVKSKAKVEFINKDKSPGLKRGGFLHIVLRKVDLISTPENILDVVQVDIGSLYVGSKIRSSDIKLPEGVSLASKKDFIVASIIGRGSKSEDDSKADTNAAAAASAAAAPAPAAKAGSSEKKK